MNSFLTIYLNLHHNIHIADLITWLLPLLFTFFHYLYFVKSNYFTNLQLQESCQMIIQSSKPIVFDYPNGTYILVANISHAQKIYNEIWIPSEWNYFITEFNLSNFLLFFMYTVCLVIIISVNSRYVLNWHYKYFPLGLITFFSGFYYVVMHDCLSRLSLEEQQLYLIHRLWLFNVPLMFFILFCIFAFLFMIVSYKIDDIHATKEAKHEIYLLMQKNQNSYVKNLNDLWTKYGFEEQKKNAQNIMNDFFDLLIENNRIGTKEDVLLFVNHIKIELKEFYFKANALSNKYVILTHIGIEDQKVYDEYPDLRKELHNCLVKFFNDISFRCEVKRNSFRCY